ncbi:MAG: glucosylceramidase, partial [Cyclobacteriaceae bacterium]|nr:glucosylceramidase [Cyclobacteriaceae bacterium]
MKISFYGQVLAATLGLALFACLQKSKEVTIKTENVEQWMTTGDKEKLLAKVAIAEVTADTTALPKIIINEAQQYQSIDGFGYSLTGGSAYLLHTKLDTAARTALLKELFLTNDQNIGVSYLRISIG